MATDYQADGREPGLHVQGHGRGVRANARALCVWRGDHHNEHRRGGDPIDLSSIFFFDLSVY